MMKQKDIAAAAATPSTIRTSSERCETIFGDWVLGQTLGKGEFGKVKLGWPRRKSIYATNMEVYHSFLILHIPILVP